MEQMVNLVVNNGLGVASFLALLYFIFFYLKQMKETMEKVNNILQSIQINMEQLNKRVEDIEKKGN